MLIREKNLKDEYREAVEAEKAKKEAELKLLADAALKAAEENSLKDIKELKPKKGKKVGGLKTKKK